MLQDNLIMLAAALVCTLVVARGWAQRNALGEPRHWLSWVAEIFGALGYAWTFLCLEEMICVWLADAWGWTFLTFFIHIDQWAIDHWGYFLAIPILGTVLSVGLQLHFGYLRPQDLQNFSNDVLRSMQRAHYEARGVGYRSDALGVTGGWSRSSSSTSSSRRSSSRRSRRSSSSSDGDGAAGAGQAVMIVVAVLRIIIAVGLGILLGIWLRRVFSRFFAGQQLPAIEEALAGTE